MIRRAPEGRAVTDANKRDVIEKILTAWKRAPELRLGQLMVNAMSNMDIFMLEDGALAERIEAFVDSLVMRERARR